MTQRIQKTVLRIVVVCAIVGGFVFLKESSEKNWISVQISRHDLVDPEWIEFKKPSTPHNEYILRYKSELDARSLGHKYLVKKINLPPWFGGALSLDLYKDKKQQRNTLYLESSGNITVIDKDHECIRSTIKDPDMKVTWCQPMPFIKPDTIKKADLEYIGTIKQANDGFIFEQNKTLEK